MGDDVNKTISYYDKGPVLAMLLDFKIRHETRNKRSLDDVMRVLYKDIYQAKQRGYTSKEFREVCEKAAGVSLGSFFEYIYTVNDVDYAKYLGYAGLTIDTANKPVPGAWLGIDARAKNDTVIISTVDWESPAWLAGVRPRQILKTIDGKPATMQLLAEIRSKKTGSIVKLQVRQGDVLKTISLILGTQFTRSFTIGKVSRPDQLQSIIFKDWSRVNP